MNAKLKEHGITDTNEVSIRYAGKEQAQNNWQGWVIECGDIRIASGFNTEGKAIQWAKRNLLQIVALA